MYKVLLVDDERIIMEGVEHFLRTFELGFDKFVYVEDGVDALEIVDEYKPDVIFTDIRMENMDGLQLTEEIRKQGEWGKRVPIVIISGYSEFEYAKRAIKQHVFEYITKPINDKDLYKLMIDIKETLDAGATGSDLIRKLEHQGVDVMIRLLNGDIQSPDEWMSLFHGAGVHPEKFVLFQLAIVYGQTSGYENTIAGTLEGEVLVKFHEGTGMLYWIGYREGNADMRSTVLNNLRIKTQRDAVTVCLSDTFRDIVGIGEAYRQIQQATRQRKLLTPGRVIHYADVRKLSDSGPGFTIELKEIVAGIKNSDLSAVTGNLHKIFEYVMTDDKVSIVYVERLYNRLIMQIWEAWSHLRSTAEFAVVFEQLESVSNRLEENATFEDMHYAVKKAVLSLFDTHKESKTKTLNASYVVQRAQEYIQKHYANPAVTLQQVAEKLNISHSYLSTIFKKETGISFGNYLKKTRLEYSLAILKDDKVKVSDIGGMVGFLGEKVFFQVFRKEMGISPAKYRRQMHAEE